MTELLRRPETKAVALVLNSLRHGPAHVPTLIAEARDKGFRVPQLTKAAYQLGIIRQNLDGEPYWLATSPSGSNALRR